MTRKELAVSLHVPGNNCAHSVLKAYGDMTGLDEKTASGIANGFGGGVRSGEICGAISGGVMALGLIAQNNGVTDLRGLTKDYVSKFAEKYGHLRCDELKEKGVPCNELIGFAAETLEEFVTAVEGGNK